METVLLCTDYLPPGGGGVEVVVETLARGLADRGLDVHVFTLDADEPHSLASDPRITVYEARTVDLTDLVGLQSQLSPAALWEFRRVVRQVDPDVVHAHNRFFFTSLVAGGWSWLGATDAPLVTTLHLGPIEELGGLSGLAASVFEGTAARAVVRASDAVVAVSEAVAEEARRLGARPESVHVVPNGVDPTEFAPADDREAGKRILFVGRLIQNKGPQVFLDALPDVLSAHPDATVGIVGTGPLADELRQQVAAAGLDDAVTFLGHVDSVAAQMQTADVFCRPSFSEGMPLTLLEAMASGLPAVVTPVAGVPEVMTDGETGCLVPTGDAAALADTLSSLLADPARRVEIGRTAREYVIEHHSWERRTERVIDIYQSLQRG